MRTRRSTSLGVAGALLVATVLSACGGSSLGSTSKSSDNGKVKVGVLVSLSGVYASVGKDMKNGFDLYLEQHGNKLGGRTVDLDVVDEGSEPQSGVAGATRLAQQDGVDVVAGIVSGPTASASRDIFDAAKVPVLMGNTGSVALGQKLKSDWIWRASYDNGDPGRLLGKELGADQSAGKVFLIGADYSGGHETLDGFKETFPKERIAGELYTPFGKTSDYSPYLAKIRASGAENVFCFYAGGEAIEFTKQFHQFGLDKTVKLYSAGFLTEGTALDAEGEAALGVLNASRYNWDLDNAENTKFVEAYQKKFDRLPTVYAANMYDIGIMLDKAIGSIDGAVTHDNLRDAIDKLGGVDGVRGHLEFDDTHTIKQPFYLLKVEKTPEGLRNVKVKDLGRS
jgi:branched-chain amino acid transport system substrate-binding protein